MTTFAQSTVARLWLASISVASFGQPLATKVVAPDFEAASIKVSAPAADLRWRPRFSGGPGSPDPGRIDYQSATLGLVIQRAYDLPFYRLSAPPWFNTEHYDIQATIPKGATEEQFRQMLQNLLAERFKLAAHRELKDIPAEQLTVDKGGPKFKAWSPGDERRLAQATANAGPPKVTTGADGYPVLPPGVSFSIVNNGHARLRAEKELMPNFAERLSGFTGGPVLDATGLKGEYAFTLSWIMPIPGAPPPPDAAPGPDLFTALEEQLGLRLVSKKAPVEILVVDHAEKAPLAN